VTGIAANLQWRYASTHAPWLLDPNADPQVIASITLIYLVPIDLSIPGEPTAP